MNNLYKKIKIVFQNIKLALRILFGFKVKSRFVLQKLAKKTCVVLGNGPSLKDMLLHPDLLSYFESVQVFCVNNFAEDNYYSMVKPTYYVICDPDYWKEDATEDANKKRQNLFDCIANKTNWNMTLFIPDEAITSKVFQNNAILKNNKIKINTFNLLGCNFLSSFSLFSFRYNLAMPHAQNVLIAALYLSLQMSYREIILLGADHSWHEDIRVDGQNRVCYINRHFNDNSQDYILEPWYKDENRVEIFKMQEILSSLSRMFEGYTIMRKYADLLKASIINSSHKSNIDAFERKEIAKLLKEKGY